ncbi:response regulator transcription factor [Nitrospirillum sp. BR 11163]|uniref:response regulator transcription factor n=1 Tax=Nitrospirillum sp. BR 11163 TaxID=3104323 RepID=UPI002AFDF1CE|nr:response regulator transcription factor [Nitrospirillum sp. BR 11163]MEA1676027.1 response regulator transcription factor [Nitrospirillum sp. BR 11163]
MRVEQSLPRGPGPASSALDRGQRPLVTIVDDDASLREALADLIASAGLQPACFASTRELLEADVLDRPGCLIVDVRMPGASGLDLQRHLAQTGNPKPIIFLTGYGDIPMTVQAMKAGAVDFLTKPVRDQTLLDAVVAAITLDTARREEAAVVNRTIDRFRKLTPREREVLYQIARGRINKQIAFDLGISEVTVKLHRSSVMRKMEVTSIVGLFRAWDLLPPGLRDLPAA